MTTQDSRKGNTPDVGLTNEEISNIMWVDNSPQAIKENTARFIHTRAMKNLSNSHPATVNPTQSQNTTVHTGTSQEQNSMEIEDQGSKSYPLNA